MVFFLDVNDKKKSQKILDWMLVRRHCVPVNVVAHASIHHVRMNSLLLLQGFAGGVMIAASYWSLLAPAIEIAEESGIYGRWAFVPAAVGFGLGAAALFATESALPVIEKLFGKPENLSKKHDDLDARVSAGVPDPMASYGVHVSGKTSRYGSIGCSYVTVDRLEMLIGSLTNATDWSCSFRRVLLLVIAITLHNLPEGMAVGVGFGSIGHSPSATFSNAVSLTIGIGTCRRRHCLLRALVQVTHLGTSWRVAGLQNFPEGLAVSMPLRREGMSAWKAFMWGQLSGLVEPIGGVRRLCLSVYGATSATTAPY